MVRKQLGRQLSPSFFSRPTEIVARELLGRVIVRQVGATELAARIVETEAYLGSGDPASHCAGGPTPRSKVMFAPPGTIYIYFIYGNYHMLNFVTEPEGIGGAVLIRAVEPVAGLGRMIRNRGWSRDSHLEPKKLRALTNGPAKLVMALGLSGELNGTLLGERCLAVREGVRVPDSQVVASARIGISKGVDLPFRFYWNESEFVSQR